MPRISLRSLLKGLPEKVKFTSIDTNSGGRVADLLAILASFGSLITGLSLIFAISSNFNLVTCRKPTPSTTVERLAESCYIHTQEAGKMTRYSEAEFSHALVVGQTYKNPL